MKEKSPKAEGFQERQEGELGATEKGV